jgi:hypothetical protein
MASRRSITSTWWSTSRVDRPQRKRSSRACPTPGISGRAVRCSMQPRHTPSPVARASSATQATVQRRRAGSLPRPQAAFPDLELVGLSPRACARARRSTVAARSAASAPKRRPTARLPPRAPGHASAAAAFATAPARGRVRRDAPLATQKARQHRLQLLLAGELPDVVLSVRLDSLIRVAGRVMPPDAAGGAAGPRR